MLLQRESEDFRSLPREVRADRRKTAFEMMDEGYTRKAIAHRVHVSISTLSEWRSSRKEIESNGYHRNKRGRQDEQKILSDAQQEEIVSALKDTLPDDHGISAFLWSRKAISEFVQKEYDILLIPQRVSVYAQRWGFSPQRPKKQALEQDEKK
jgi:transposase